MNKGLEKREKGFTLLEVLIVVGILALLVTLSAKPLLSFYRNIRFQGAVENVLTMLDEARKSTLSSYNSSQYGVHFETNRTVLFRGDTFTEPNPENDEYIFSDIIEISSSTFSGGGDDVVFERITGETANGGVLEIVLLTASSTRKIITIHTSGLVEVD